MSNAATVHEEGLDTVETTMKALNMSRTYLFKLPDGTPGKYRFGRSVRFNIRELKEWARRQQPTTTMRESKKVEEKRSPLSKPKVMTSKKKPRADKTKG